MPLVQQQPRTLPRGDAPQTPVHPLRSRAQARLAVLRLVSWARVRARIRAQILRSRLQPLGSLREPFVRAPLVDAVHAVLPVVQTQGAAALEDPGHQTQVWTLRLGSPSRFLESLPVVRQDAGQRTKDAQVKTLARATHR